MAITEKDKQINAENQKRSITQNSIINGGSTPSRLMGLSEEERDLVKGFEEENKQFQNFTSPDVLKNEIENASHGQGFYYNPEISSTEQITERQLQPGELDYGESKYNEGLLNVDSDDVIQNQRASNQSGLAQLGAGVAKMGVLTASTAIDGTAGLLWGLKSFANSGDFHDMWNNDLSNWLDSWSTWADEAMPQYQSTYAQNNEWYGNLGRANFWSDVIKNSGFMWGAMLGGKVPATLLGKGAGKVASWAGKTAEEIDNISAYAAQGGGVLSAAANESGVQARETYKKALEAYAKPVNDRYNEQIRSIDSEIAQIDNQLAELSKYVNSPENQFGILPEIQEEYNRLMDIKEAKTNSRDAIENQRRAEMKEYEEYAFAAGNLDFAQNMAILTPMDLIGIGKMYRRGFDKSVESGLVKGVWGDYTAGKKSMFGVASNMINEGAQEIAQSISSNTALKYNAANAINHYNNKYNPDAQKEVADYMGSLIDGFAEGIVDPQAWEEAFSVFLTMGVGHPTIRSKSEMKDADGKTKGRFGWEGSIFNEYSDIKNINEKTQMLVDHLNEVSKTRGEATKTLFNNLAHHRYMDKVMDKALAEKDEFTYRNAEMEQMIGDVAAFSRAGRIEDLRNAIKNASEFDNEGIADLISATTEINDKGELYGPFSEYAKKDGEGNVISQELSDTQKKDILDKINKNVDKQMKLIDSWDKTRRSLFSSYGNENNSELIDELTYMKLFMDHYPDRVKEMSASLKDVKEDLVSRIKSSFALEESQKKQRIEKLENEILNANTQMNPTIFSEEEGKELNKYRWEEKQAKYNEDLNNLESFNKALENILNGNIQFFALTNTDRQMFTELRDKINEALKAGKYDESTINTVANKFNDMILCAENMAKIREQYNKYISDLSNLEKDMKNADENINRDEKKKSIEEDLDKELSKRLNSKKDIDEERTLTKKEIEALRKAKDDDSVELPKGISRKDEDLDIDEEIKKRIEYLNKLNKASKEKIEYDTLMGLLEKKIDNVSNPRLKKMFELYRLSLKGVSDIEDFFDETNEVYQNPSKYIPIGDMSKDNYDKYMSEMKNNLINNLSNIKNALKEQLDKYDSIVDTIPTKEEVVEKKVVKDKVIEEEDEDFSDPVDYTTSETIDQSVSSDNYNIFSTSQYLLYFGKEKIKEFDELFPMYVMAQKLGRSIYNEYTEERNKRLEIVWKYLNDKGVFDDRNNKPVGKGTQIKYVVDYDLCKKIQDELGGQITDDNNFVILMAVEDKDGNTTIDGKNYRIVGDVKPEWAIKSDTESEVIPGLRGLISNVRNEFTKSGVTEGIFDSGYTNEVKAEYEGKLALMKDKNGKKRFNLISDIFSDKQADGTWKRSKTRPVFEVAKEDDKKRKIKKGDISVTIYNRNNNDGKKIRITKPKSLNELGKNNPYYQYVDKEVDKLLDVISNASKTNGDKHEAVKELAKMFYLKLGDGGSYSSNGTKKTNYAHILLVADGKKDNKLFVRMSDLIKNKNKRNEIKKFLYEDCYLSFDYKKIEGKDMSDLKYQDVVANALKLEVFKGQYRLVSPYFTLYALDPNGNMVKEDNGAKVEFSWNDKGDNEIIINKNDNIRVVENQGRYTLYNKDGEIIAKEIESFNDLVGQGFDNNNEVKKQLAQAYVMRNAFAGDHAIRMPILGNNIYYMMDRDIFVDSDKVAEINKEADKNDDTKKNKGKEAVRAKLGKKDNVEEQEQKVAEPKSPEFYKSVLGSKMAYESGDVLKIVELPEIDGKVDNTVAEEALAEAIVAIEQGASVVINNNNEFMIKTFNYMEGYKKVEDKNGYSTYELDPDSNSTVADRLNGKKKVDNDENNDASESKQQESQTSEVSQESTEKIFDDAIDTNKKHIIFNENEHTYIIDGTVADYTVTGLAHPMEREEETRTIEIDGKEQTVAGFLEVSSSLGRTYDEIARDLLGILTNPFEESYANTSTKQRDAFIHSLETFIDKLGERDEFKNGMKFITNEDALRVYGKVKVNGKMKTVAGTMDMIIIDSKGDVNIVDFKTKRSNRGNKFYEDTLQGYSDQVHLYAKLLEEMYPSLKGHVHVLGLAKFELKYNEPNGSRDNENGKTDYIEDNGQIFVIEEGKKTPIQDTKGYSGALFTDIEKVKSPSKKMVTDKLELKGEGVKIEGDKDFEEYLKKAQKELEERNKAKQEEDEKRKEEERLKKEAEEKAKKEEEERNANKSTAEALAKAQQIDDNSKNEYTLKNLGVTITAPYKLNNGQESALYSLDEFVTSQDETMMVVQGYAGTGKTSLMLLLGEALKQRGKSIQWCATTNAAAKNLSTVVNDTATSMHAQFGLKVNKTGNAEKSSEEILPGIYVIDESSMITRENLEDIMERVENQNKSNLATAKAFNTTPKLVKIVFLGDPEQLPPVDKKSKSLEAPVFEKDFIKDSRKVTLTQVMRTGDNAILKEATALREGNDASYISHFNKKGEGIAYINSKDEFDLSINAFSDSIMSGNTLLVAASNNRVTDLNRYVRQVLGYKDTIPVTGETMMLYKNYKVTELKNGRKADHYFLVNGGRYKVVKAEVVKGNSAPIAFINRTCERVGYDARLDENAYKNMPMVSVTLLNEDNAPQVITYYDIDLLNEDQKKIISELGEQFETKKIDGVWDPKTGRKEGGFLNDMWAKWRKMSRADESYEKNNLRDAMLDFQKMLDMFPIMINKDVKGKDNKKSELIEKSIDFGYACTIHKSQGQTFDNVLFDMDDIEKFPQEKMRRRLSYVAISRARKTVTVLSGATKRKGNASNGVVVDIDLNPTKKSNIFGKETGSDYKSNKSERKEFEDSDDSNTKQISRSKVEDDIEGDKNSKFASRKEMESSDLSSAIKLNVKWSMQINISSMSESEKNKASHKEHLMFNRLIPDLSIEHRDNLVGEINRAIERGDSQSIIDMKNSIELLCNPNIVAGKVFDDAINSILPFVVDNENIQAIMQEIGEESLSKAYKKCIDGIDDYSDVTTKAFKSIDKFIKEFSKQKTRINVIIDNLTNGKTSDNRQFQKNIKKDDKKYSYNDEIKEYGIEENEWNEMTEEEKEHIKNVCL